MDILTMVIIIFGTLILISTIFNKDEQNNDEINKESQGEDLKK